MSDNYLLPPFIERMVKSADLLVFPAVGAQLVPFMNKPIEQKNLVQIIEQDPGLTATLLRNINAASVPVAKEICSIERAVNILGTRQSFAIAFTQIISTQLRSTATSVKTTLFLDFWRRSLLTALFAERLDARLQTGIENAYTLGLLYHLGMILMLESYGDYYIGQMRSVGTDLDKLIEKEREHYETDFEHVGHWVMSKWGFPASILDPLHPDTPSTESTRQVIIIAAEIANRCLSFEYGENALSAMPSESIDLLLDPTTSPNPAFDPAFHDWYQEIILGIRETLSSTKS